MPSLLHPTRFEPAEYTADAVFFTHCQDAQVGGFWEQGEAVGQPRDMSTSCSATSPYVESSADICSIAQFLAGFDVVVVVVDDDDGYGQSMGSKPMISGQLKKLYSRVKEELARMARLSTCGKVFIGVNIELNSSSAQNPVACDKL